MLTEVYAQTYDECITLLDLYHIGYKTRRATRDRNTQYICFCEYVIEFHRGEIVSVDIPAIHTHIYSNRIMCTGNKVWFMWDNDYCTHVDTGAFQND